MSCESSPCHTKRLSWKAFYIWIQINWLVQAKKSFKFGTYVVLILIVSHFARAEGEIIPRVSAKAGQTMRTYCGSTKVQAVTYNHIWSQGFRYLFYLRIFQLGIFGKSKNQQIHKAIRSSLKIEGSVKLKNLNLPSFFFPLESL